MSRCQLQLFEPGCKIANDSLDEQAKGNDALFELQPSSASGLERPMVVEGFTGYTAKASGRTSYKIASKISSLLALQVTRATECRSQWETRNAL